MSTLKSQFELVKRNHGECWKHASKPHWIVFYNTEAQKPFYQAYKVKDWITVPKGREPWTCDNVRLGDAKDGYPTLYAAMKAAA